MIRNRDGEGLARPTSGLLLGNQEVDVARRSYCGYTREAELSRFDPRSAARHKCKHQCRYAVRHEVMHCGGRNELLHSTISIIQFNFYWPRKRAPRPALPASGLAPTTTATPLTLSPSLPFSVVLATLSTNHCHQRGHRVYPQQWLRWQFQSHRRIQAKELFLRRSGWPKPGLPKQHQRGSQVQRM